MAAGVPVTPGVVLASLAPDLRQRAEELLAGLRGRGYRDRERFNELEPGARVRHRGHQYPEAYRAGTGTIVAVTERDPSAWSESWGLPDVEIVVAWDDPSLWRVSNVAQYHIYAVRERVAP